MTKHKITYIHDEIGHNLKAPSVIVPVLVDVFNPKSVIDIGCGLGTFIKKFKDNGVKDVLGIDGEWTNRELLYKNISEDDFLEADVSKPLVLKRKYDLAISLEVAEHLSEKYGTTLVESLTNASDIILFSAAVPYQGGFNHLNEQWADYWEILFKEKGFVEFDVLKTIFWNDPQIDFWYKQNMVLYIKDRTHVNMNYFDKYPKQKLNRVIHSELYIKKASHLEKILSGDMEFLFYCKLILKLLINKIK